MIIYVYISWVDIPIDVYIYIYILYVSDYVTCNFASPSFGNQEPRLVAVRKSSNAPNLSDVFYNQLFRR